MKLPSFARFVGRGVFLVIFAAERQKRNLPSAEVKEESDIDLGLDIDLDLGDDLDFSDMGMAFSDTRYLLQKPKKISQKCVTYANAVQMARDIDISDGGRCDAIISGEFIFGDLIEAYITEHNIRCREMIISTLSLSQENVDTLKNLIAGGYVDDLSIIISAYFYSHERNALIPYMYETLDVDCKFQLSVAGVHTKTVQFESVDGAKIVMHGSANLRSNANIEQFTIEDNPMLYDFYASVFRKIEEQYHTINKPLRKISFTP